MRHMIAALIRIFVELPKPYPRRCAGIDSSRVFGAAVTKTPLANPWTSLETAMSPKLTIRELKEAPIATTLKMITILILPLESICPPIIDPRAMPRIDSV